MVKANWHVFNAKFSGDTQGNFEWFSYLLFCQEFERPKGIFRYKNQSAIETDPIDVDRDVVGWQAKYYDAPLSQHKRDLLSTLEMARRDYPTLTQLHLYTNQEWSQNKGKKPQGLTEIEALSSKLGIEIVWKTASFFESEFVIHRNEVIASHFFSAAGGIVAQIDEQQGHTAAILNAIQTSILYNDRSIEIDRKSYLDDLNNASTNIFILSCPGGVGKTVLVKKLYEKLKDSVPFYVFKASEFELASINYLFPNTGFKAFVEAHQDEQTKIVVIDSAEKLLDFTNQDPFKEFLSAFIRNGWTIIFTTRNNYLEDLITSFWKYTPSSLKIFTLMI